MQCNCLKNIIDQNINTDDETNTCQLIKHTSYYDVEQFKHLADSIHKAEFTVLSSNIQSINAKLNEPEIFTEELQKMILNFQYNNLSTRKLDHRFKRHVANSISRLQLYNSREK